MPNPWIHPQLVAAAYYGQLFHAIYPKFWNLFWDMKISQKPRKKFKKLCGVFKHEGELFEITSTMQNYWN